MVYLGIQAMGILRAIPAEVSRLAAHEAHRMLCTTCRRETKLSTPCMVEELEETQTVLAVLYSAFALGQR